MPETTPFDLEAYIKAEVDRAVTPYAGRMPPWALDKMRELADRYWRENPVALESLRRRQQRERDRSGTQAIHTEANHTQTDAEQGKVSKGKG